MFLSKFVTNSLKHYKIICNTCKLLQTWSNTATMHPAVYLAIWILQKISRIHEIKRSSIPEYKTNIKLKQLSFLVEK